MTRAGALQKIREGGSSALAAAPVGVDILTSPHIVGWHEFDGSTWTKAQRAGVTSIGPAVALSRSVVLSGFDSTAMNMYVERREPHFIVNNHETFWSVDSEFFIFWCKRERRWKVALASNLHYNREGGSKAFAAAPEHEDILRQQPLLVGWFEWDGTTWAKRKAAGVVQLGAFSTASCRDKAVSG